MRVAGIIAFTSVAFFFVSCGQGTGSSNREKTTKTQQDSAMQDSIYQEKEADYDQKQYTNVVSPKELVEDLLIAAKSKDINTFISLIPENGVIISIDNFIDTTRGDHLLTPNIDVNKPLFWGLAPSGDSIIMTFREVFNTYVAKDFLSGISSTQPECLSTVEFNVSEIWQNVSIYEYCLNPPSKKNDMLNWEAIRFVFVGDSLVAIVLDRWTP